MSAKEEEVEAKNLFTSEPSYQDKSCSECQHDVRKQLYCYTAILSECQQDVRKHYVSMSLCPYVRMSI